MTTPRVLRRALVRARRDTAFLAVGVPLHLVAPTLCVWAVAVTLKTGTWVYVPAPVTLLLVSVLTLPAAERLRYRVLLGVDIPRPDPVPGPRGPRSVLHRLRSAQTWRRFAYHTLVGPVLAAVELLVLTAWAAGAVSITVYAWVDFGNTTQGAYLTAAGLALLCACPWLAGAARRMQTRVVTALLGPGRTRELQRRVEDLTLSRADLVDAADAERRRIERDLHDGAQQRLVSLAVNLGLARATLTDLPEEARRVIDEAHREAKDAIAELNDLVRGLHPVVLEDRGLDAALSGLAARVALPVRLRVDLEERAAPTVESVAYFVVSEALTNVTKHARATRANVTVERVGEVLRVNVTDDGVGGADARSGTGLSGLAKRVRSVDGTLRISSPAGGPTTVAVELPCAL